MKIAFDVDGTLITSNDEPRWPVIDLLRWFHGHTNYEIIIWSGGGIDYAKHWRDKLGFKQVANVFEKGSVAVDIAVDDQGIPPEGVKAKVLIRA